MSSSIFTASEVDLKAHPTALKLIEHCIPFLEVLSDQTPGPALEARLNTEYAPHTPFYTGLKELVLTGLEEKWLASVELEGSRYRRSRICGPCEATRYFSMTAVYMDSGFRPATSTSAEEGQQQDVYEKTESNDKAEFSGQFHIHPYGEINTVITLDDSAQMRGIDCWQGPGWTSPGPGTRHYPTVRGGRVIALFFLPAGRIAYPAKPPVRGPGGLVDVTPEALSASDKEGLN